MQGTQAMKPTLAQELAQRACAMQDLSAAVATKARHALLDWFAVTLAGASEPVARHAAAALEDCPGPVSLIGQGRSAHPMAAALINGCAAHALDYDDTIPPMMGHPTAPIATALLAEAQVRGASGRAVLAAYVAGVEVACRVGLFLGVSHYLRGFHATGTVGAVGAAAAVAHLRGASADTMAHALCLAAAEASGLKIMFGTMGKPFQAGHAALNGLVAARLAHDGLTAHLEALEGPQGLGATHSDGCDVAVALADPAEPYVMQLLFKFHAACHLTHSSIEALLALRSETPFDAADVAEVHLAVTPQHLKVCAIEEPCNGLEGKFSLKHTAALCLAGMPTDERGFTEAMIAQMAPWRALVTLQVTEDAVTALPMATAVRLRLKNGRVLEHCVDVGRPLTSLDAEEQRLVAKFTGLVEPVLGAVGCRDLLQQVLAWEHLDDAGKPLEAAQGLPQMRQQTA
jgi:2-methylcitrate dehydratase PrpD